MNTSKLNKKYHSVKNALENNQEVKDIEYLKKIYKVDTNEKLLYALKPHPVSIVLAQAAIESAWLTSRFTKNANNIFGVWSFDKNEPRILATGSRGKKNVYLKKYKNYREAVENYYFNLGRAWAYADFRKLRTETDDPYALLPHLKIYSEKREAYVDMLKSVIKFNKFEQYDIK